MSEVDNPLPQVVQHSDHRAVDGTLVAPTGHDIVASSARTSFTRVEEEELLHRPSTSQDPIPPLPTPNSVPTQQDVTGEQVPPLLSSCSPSQKDLLVETNVEPTLEEPVPQMAQVFLTFLLISGKRRTMNFDPETTVGRVKELVWNSWPTDWQDVRPPAPSYLRVLYLGRMLQDDETLIKLKLTTHTPSQPVSSASSSNGPTPTIMHLSIRPYPLAGEGDAIKKKKKRGQDDGSASNVPRDEVDNEALCCRCIIC